MTITTVFLEKKKMNKEDGEWGCWNREMKEENRGVVIFFG